VLSVGFSTLGKNLRRAWGKWGKLFVSWRRSADCLGKKNLAPQALNRGVVYRQRNSAGRFRAREAVVKAGVVKL
jgi:hypothetical protein